ISYRNVHCMPLQGPSPLCIVAASGQTHRKVGTQSHRSKGGIPSAEPRIAGLPKQVNSCVLARLDASPVLHSNSPIVSVRPASLPGESHSFAQLERKRFAEGEHTLNPAIVMPITRLTPSVGYS